MPSHLYIEWRAKRNILYTMEGVSTNPDECMGVGLEIGTSSILGNEVLENRSGRQLYFRIE